MWVLAQNRGIQMLLPYGVGVWGPGTAAGDGGALLDVGLGVVGDGAQVPEAPLNRGELISLQLAEQWTKPCPRWTLAPRAARTMALALSLSVNRGFPGWLTAPPPPLFRNLQGPLWAVRGRHDASAPPRGGWEGRREASGMEDAQEKHETQEDVNLYLEKSSRARSSGGRGHQRGVLEAGTRPHMGERRARAVTGAGGGRCQDRREEGRERALQGGHTTPTCVGRSARLSPAPTSRSRDPPPFPPPPARLPGLQVRRPSLGGRGRGAACGLRRRLFLSQRRGLARGLGGRRPCRRPCSPCRRRRARLGGRLGPLLDGAVAFPPGRGRLGAVLAAQRVGPDGRQDAAVAFGVHLGVVHLQGQRGADLVLREGRVTRGEGGTAGDFPRVGRQPTSHASTGTPPWDPRWHSAQRYPRMGGSGLPHSAPGPAARQALPEAGSRPGR